MTLISSLITDAFREGNILPLGIAPNALQTAEALRLLNASIASIYGDEAGEALQDWPLGNYGREVADYYFLETDYLTTHPGLNRRLLVENEAAQTVSLDPQPQDGARMAIADPLGRLASVPVTLDANGRTIEGAATILLNTNGLFREWFYRADLAQWVRLTTLAETDKSPFPADFDNFMITLLALRINPRYGRSMDEQSAAIYRTERTKFVNRYLQSARLQINDDISWPFMTNNRRYAFSDVSNFSTGQYSRR